MVSFFYFQTNCKRYIKDFKSFTCCCMRIILVNLFNNDSFLFYAGCSSAVYVCATCFSILQGLTDNCSGYLTIIQWGWAKKKCRSEKMLSAEMGYSSQKVLNSEIRTILPHNVRKPNSITVLSFIQKFSNFLTNYTFFKTLAYFLLFVACILLKSR